MKTLVVTFFLRVQSTPVSDGNKQPKSTMDCKKIQLSSVNKLIIFHCYDAITVTTYTFHQKPATSQGNKKKRDSFLKCNLKVGCRVFYAPHFLCQTIKFLFSNFFLLWNAEFYGFTFMGIYGSDVSSGLGLAPYFDFVVLPQIDEVCFIFHRNWEKPAKEHQKTRSRKWKLLHFSHQEKWEH